MELTAAPSVTGKPRFHQGGKRRNSPNTSAMKEKDQRARRRAIQKSRPVVNYGKDKKLVQGLSDTPDLRVGRMPEVVSKRAKKFGASRA